MNKMYPLLPYNGKILGIVSIIFAVILIAYSLFFNKINVDIIILLICFGLFCFGYSKEKDENETYLLYRYHSFRIAFVLTTVIILIISSAFIFDKTAIGINCLYALLLMCLSFNIVYIIIKNIGRKKSTHE
jgi:ammonia channel protein AmtB